MPGFWANLFSKGVCMDKKERIFREVGKVVVNLGNLIFTGMVLGTILKGDYDKLLMIIIGCCLAFLLIVGGITCLVKGGE
jgi:hypothetical protein